MIKPKKTLLRNLKYILLGLTAFTAVYPFIWMVLYSLKSTEEIFITNPFGLPRDWLIENYITAFKSYNVLLYMGNSMIVAFFTVSLTILLALMFSYAVARMKLKMMVFLKTYVLAGMFVPVQIILIPLLILVKNFHLGNTFASIILPYVAFGLPFSTIVFYAFFRSIPYAMEESAFLDGAGIFTTFFLIILPLVKPAIATVLILRFLSSWNEFTLALVLISDNAIKTLPLGLISFQGQFATNWGAMGAALTIASLPTLSVYLLFSNHVEKAMSMGSAVKG